MSVPGFPIQPFKNEIEPLIATAEARPEPATADGNKALADEHIDKGRVQHAITRYKKAARMDNDPSHRTDLGDAYAFAELPVKAIEQYKRAIKANPERPEAHFSIAEVLIRYGKWQTAVTEYALAVEYGPENAYYRYKYANACLQCGFREDAIAQLEAAVSLHPDDAFYHFELASLYADCGYNQQAADEMEKAVASCANDDYYLSRLAMLYVRLGQFELAADTYLRAIDLSPSKLSYRWLLADVYNSLGDVASAEYHYGKSDGIDDYEIDFVERARKYSQGGCW